GEPHDVGEGHRPRLAHQCTVTRPSAAAPIGHMGAALLAALRCSLISAPCLVPRPLHRSATWELRSSLRCGARSSVGLDLDAARRGGDRDAAVVALLAVATDP